MKDGRSQSHLWAVIGRGMHTRNTVRGQRLCRFIHRLTLLLGYKWWLRGITFTRVHKLFFGKMLRNIPLTLNICLRDIKHKCIVEAVCSQDKSHVISSWSRWWFVINRCVVCNLTDFLQQDWPVARRSRGGQSGSCTRSLTHVEISVRTDFQILWVCRLSV